MTDQSATDKAPSKALVITGFTLGVGSIALAIVPYLNLVLAASGLVVSLVSKRSRVLPGLRIAGIVLASVGLLPGFVLTGFVVGATFSTSDSAACADLNAQLVPIGVTMKYLKADMTAQNLTGSYDLASIRREGKLLETQVSELSAISGSQNFNAMRREVVDSFNQLARVFQNAGAPGFAEGAQAKEDAAVAAASHIAQVCK